MPDNRHRKEFVKLLESIKPEKNTYDVFSDWLILAAAGLYAWKKDPKVESEYMEVAKNYSKEDLDKHTQLLMITVNALEEKDQDFLGEIFIDGEYTNDRKAQFFTPFHISELMAEINFGDTDFPKDKVCTVYDPCCGSGVMLVASISVMKKRKIDFQRDVFFLGTDIDARCARMAYIQLSLLGAPAVITCGNTLTKETFWERETFFYHFSGMDFRLRNSEETKEAEKPKEPERIITVSKDYFQGELF
jgi:type I restriction-modification system DNA methylase subunit